MPHLNVFCALGAQLLPSFIQYHYYEVVLIHEGLIKSETLHLNKVLRKEEPWYIFSFLTIYESSCWFFLLCHVIYDLHPRDMMAQFWPLMSPCTTYKASTHHLIKLKLSALKMSGMCIVLRRNWSNLHKLSQSSASGSIILAARKSTDVWMSFLTLRVVNISCATLWCNTVYCYLSNILFS